MLDNMITVLIGYSGHGYVVAEAAIEAGFNVNYYTDLNKIDFNPYNLKYLGFEGDKNFNEWHQGYNYILGIGDNKLRNKIASLVIVSGAQLGTVIHPTASVSKWSKLGLGVFVARNVMVNPISTIGDFSILNTGSIIEHECILGEAVHIAPGAILSGNVRVGNRSFIGANAVIKQGVVIGEDVLVGAGAVILKNVPSGSKIVGNPGRLIK